MAAAAVLGACVSGSGAPAPEVLWSATNTGTDSTGVSRYVQTFRLTGIPDSMDRLAFNMFARSMTPADSLDSIIELVPGYYAVASQRIREAGPEDTVLISIVTRGSIKSVCYSPDGVHGVGRNGGLIDLGFSRADLLDDSLALAAAPSPQGIYERNAALAGDSAGIFDAVPSFKDVRLTGGETEVDFSAIRFVDAVPSENPEAYTVTIAEGAVTVAADSTQRARIASRLRRTFGPGTRTLPQAVITDSPDLPYRGLMIDVARNFQPAVEMHRILDLMASYGLNTLHFHLTDDEAWRFEVAALPELTATGARRGYTPEGTEPGFLPQIFAGNGNPDATAGTANGFYSRADMVSLLRHADSLAINVIPEIESPGHARAAIVAMRNRPDYRLDEPADTSRYTSAQAFHDNVMNPALPGPYRFMQTVVDELADIYAEAGVPLRAIHIGGDEVPRNAWAGSPAVNELKQRENLADDKDVHAYFVSRVADFIASKGIGVSGWQEIALRHPEAYNNALRPKVYSVNCWSTLPRQGQGGVIRDIWNADFPIVLSNVDHFYMDMCYNPHPDERGLSWGGYVDEFDALAGYPARLAPGMKAMGVQGQVFAETIRSEAGLETMILPKMLGLAERGWNVDSTYSDARFNAVANSHIGQWQAEGLAYHVRQPGVLVADGVMTVNSSYPDAVIRWSADGNNPDTTGNIIEAGQPVDISTLPAGTEIRVRQWVGDIPSATTVCRL